MAHPYQKYPRFAGGQPSVRDVFDHREAGPDTTNMAAIRASAEIFVERFGDDAPRQAAIRARELLEARQYQARVRWQLIGKEVDNILSKKKLVEFDIGQSGGPDDQAI